MTDAPLKHPSAWMPIAMSLSALVMLMGYIAIYGSPAQPEPVHDERAPARIFQLLMLAQAPFIAYFALKWLPRVPGQALLVLALQAAAAASAIGAVIWAES